jgi:hypothetical protein
MAVRVSLGTPEGKNPEDDIVYRQQIAAAARQDQSDEYTTAEVEVEFGPAPKSGSRSRARLVLKYAYDATFLFAVYADNPELQKIDRDAWDAIARNGLEKFCALKNLAIKLGPLPELHNRYNWHCEVNRVIEYRESTLVALATQAEEAAKRKAAMEEFQRLQKLMAAAL